MNSLHNLHSISLKIARLKSICTGALIRQSVCYWTGFKGLSVIFGLSFFTIQVAAIETAFSTFEELTVKSDIMIPSKKAIDLIVLDEAVTLTLKGNGNAVKYLKKQGYDSYKAFSLMNNHSKPLLKLIEMVNIRKDRQKALNEVSKPYSQAISKDVSLWMKSLGDSQKSGVLKSLANEITNIKNNIKSKSPGIAKNILISESNKVFFGNASITIPEAEAMLNEFTGIDVITDELILLIYGNNKSVDKLIVKITADVTRHTLSTNLNNLNSLQGEYKAWQAQVDAR